MDGVVWDESTDTSSGYEGTNIVDLVTFNNSAAYRVPTDDLLLLRINSKKRGILFKSTFTPETGDAIMRFGQFVSVALYCVSADGMYVSDNPYTLTIEDNSYEQIYNNKLIGGIGGCSLIPRRAIHFRWLVKP